MLGVSIIIVNWNTIDFLKQCLSSLSLGVGKIPYEVIFVDNASIDQSANFVEDNFPKVKLIKNKTNIGFAAACNQGSALANYDYLFFLNPDTILTQDSVKKLIDYAEINSKVGAIGPQLIGRDGKTQNSVRKFPNLRDIIIKNTIIKRVFSSKKDKYLYNLSDKEPSYVDQVSGAAFLMKRNIWQDVGGMDERFFMFYEEVDLCKRLKDLGYNIVYLPCAKVTHLGGGSRHKDKSRVFCYSLRSMFQYMDKYESRKKMFWFRLFFKPLFIMEMLVGIFNATKRGFLKSCLLEFIKF